MMNEGDRLTFLRLLPDALHDPGLVSETLALVASRIHAGSHAAAKESAAVDKVLARATQAEAALAQALARAKKAEADVAKARATIARQRQSLQEARRAP